MSASGQSHHQNIPLYECKQYLVELLQNPADHELISETFTGRVISRLAFGDDRFDGDLRTHSHALLEAISPAAKMTNIIPQLKVLPYWLSPWKISERARHARERQFFEMLYNEVSNDIIRGSQKPSYMSTFLQAKAKTGMSDLEGSYTVGMVGLAGILTTASAFMTYILAMCLYPEWQKRLQEEVDSVCGDRMPRPDDAPNMPTLRAVIKEIMRWRPVTPSSKFLCGCNIIILELCIDSFLGIPHESEADFIYDGYFIPKGSHIHPSQWQVSLSCIYGALFNPL